MFNLIFIFLLTFVLSCSEESQIKPENDKKTTNKEEELENSLRYLQGQINSLIESDFATCNSVGINDTLATKICQIAQAATVEDITELKSNLALFSSSLNEKLQDTQNDFAVLEAQWKKIFGVSFPGTTGGATPTLSDCLNNNATASLIECMKISASAINNLATTVAKTMLVVEIGTENLLAGPTYEQILRLSDKTRINAYMDGLGSLITTNDPNPIDTTNTSSTIVINATAHGLNTGNKIKMRSCSSGNGLLAKHLYGIFSITKINNDSFSIVLSASASATGSIGSNSCEISSYTGAGMNTIWTTADVQDTAVRTTNSSSIIYNFMICKNSSNEGILCYDSTDNLATYATIFAGLGVNCAGSGNIVCK